MHKTTTQKDFKVFLLRSVFSLLMLSISFQVSFAQQKALVKPPSATKGQPTERPAAAKAAVNQATTQRKFGFATQNGPSDVPAVNKAFAEKTTLKKNPAFSSSTSSGSILPTTSS